MIYKSHMALPFFLLPINWTSFYYAPLSTHSQVQVQVQVQAFVSALWHAMCLWTHFSFICFIDRPSVSSTHMSEEDPRFVQVQSFSILLLSWPAFVQWLKAFSFGFQWFSVRIPFFHSKFLYILLIMHFREIVEFSPTKRHKKSIPGSPDIQLQPHHHLPLTTVVQEKDERLVLKSIQNASDVSIQSNMYPREQLSVWRRLSLLGENRSDIV